MPTEVMVIESAAYQAMKAMHEEAVQLVKVLATENLTLKHKYLNPTEVGFITGYNSKTIKLRKEEIGYITQGKDIRFKLEDVKAWMDSYYVHPKRRR